MKLFLASGNAHKVRELREIAAAENAALAAQSQLGGQPACPLAFTIESAAVLGGMPPVVEDTGSFLGNARKKARALVPLLPPDGWALADDSGLCVDALEGGPGVESAYFAGPQADSAANLQKLVEVMRGIPAERRGAHYVCVLVLLGAGGREYSVRGECHGRLALEPVGQGGFGYDPLFVPRGFEHTFGELPEAVKRARSHRSAAWRALIEQLAQ
ncbi:non-canonical purine NTP pyrophosphatase [Cephaloticoccus primus]|uniref:dITP/XTP pyrophosphatase n=1 Tax=Cephaloticoccus primus TaxID=1548207 RepID=A0A139SPJ7_9BACT|nr:non-canonical purine NTP pyrophosphatase [Cephaloticoccus primus]KXU36519.1 non-canonical purine NTP pyrophosphatase [Cephaloticoccus primus]